MELARITSSWMVEAARLDTRQNVLERIAIAIRLVLSVVAEHYADNSAYRNLQVDSDGAGDGRVAPMTQALQDIRRMTKAAEGFVRADAVGGRSSHRDAL